MPQPEVINCKACGAFYRPYIDKTLCPVCLKWKALTGGLKDHADKVAGIAARYETEFAAWQHLTASLIYKLLPTDINIDVQLRAFEKASKGESYEEYINRRKQEQAA